MPLPSRPALAIVLLAAACASRRAREAPSPGARAERAARVVQRQVDAYNAQDLEAFVAMYADDVVITRGESDETIVRGKDALRDRFGDIFRRFPLNHARIVERRAGSDGVVLDHEIVTGRAPDKPDPWDVGWVRYEVEDGVIRRVHLP